jgi:hypothetical protein
MPGYVSVRRGIAFGVSATVLVTGVLVLATQAADARYVDGPGTDDGTVQVDAARSTGPDDAPVVDRLSTWSETAKKKSVSPVKGGGKNK